MITLKKSLAPAMVMASLLVLAGCVQQHPTLDDAVHMPASPDEAYPITVAKGPQTLEVSTRSGSLEPSQVNAVSAFINNAMSAGITPVHVLRPSGGGKSGRVASEVVNLMAQAGMPRNRIHFGTYRGSASAPIRLSFISTYAKTRKCGVWSEDLTAYESNGVMENEGCAVQANIAAMTANPETFLVPQTAAATSGSTTGSLGSSPTTGGGFGGSGGYGGFGGYGAYGGYN